MESSDAVSALGALAQETRLALFRLLVERGPDGYPAGEIAAALAIPGPTLSFHLRALAQAGLVVARKESRFLYYSADFERMAALVAYLTENCCARGGSCAPSCAPKKRTPRRKRR
ncbi:MAG: ArsR/SmtB family transcription factor [Gammaproteobacteria bacterium]